MPTLYHTDGCHLCDQAMELLTKCNVDYQLVDIVFDEHLVAQFGTRIPVLASDQSEQLNWPFDAQQIQQFLSPNKSE